jgi:GT2 family glycosyltransferase
MTHIRLPQELGGAGAVHVGMNLVYKKRYDWVWVMDDDASPLPNALEELVKVIIGGQIPIDTIGALVSRRVWPIDRLDPTIPQTKFEIINGTAFAGFPLLSRKLECSSSLRNVESVSCTFFSGVLFPCRAIKCVGLPLREFFIFWDDIEYSQRLIDHGFNLYQVLTSYVVHPLWKSYRNKRFLTRTISLEDYQDWRTYYVVRNEILMYKYQHHQYPLHYTFLRTLLRILRWFLRGVLIQIILRLLLKDTGKIKFILKGAVDGLLGRTGKGKSVSPGDRHCLK